MPIKCTDKCVFGPLIIHPIKNDNIMSVPKVLTIPCHLYGTIRRINIYDYTWMIWHPQILILFVYLLLQITCSIHLFGFGLFCLGAWVTLYGSHSPYILCSDLQLITQHGHFWVLLTVLSFIIMVHGLNLLSVYNLETLKREYS